MKFDLTAMAATKRKSRNPITLANIRTTQAQADDLTAIYLRALEPLNAAVALIPGEYQRELERVLQTDSIDTVGATVDAIAAAINRLVLELTPELRRWALRVEEVHRGKWVRSILSATSVDLETMLFAHDVEETIRAFIERNVSLVRDVNQQARGRIADAVFRGFQKRAPANEVAKEISEAVGMARKRARRIASHQTVSLGSALNDQRRRQAGLPVWRWNHSSKKHPRAEHLARDGNLYSDDAAERGTVVKGKTIGTPPAERPGELPNCGCVSQSVLIFEGEML